MSKEVQELTPELLLAAYASGYFPMAETKGSDELLWFHPDLRGVLPLESFHVPRSLAKVVKRRPFTITEDKAFEEVMRHCAMREETWINERIIQLYCALHQMGFAHSVECWQEETLVGGLYGVSLGCAFFGESMFSHVPNGSRVALVHLVSRLREMGYSLLDTQFINQHLLQFGVIEIPRGDYMARLEKAVYHPPLKSWQQ